MKGCWKNKGYEEKVTSLGGCRGFAWGRRCGDDGWRFFGRIFMADSGVPAGFVAVSPYLIVEDAWEQVRFLKEVFGARELMMMGEVGGAIRHAEFEVCGVKVMVS